MKAELGLITFAFFGGMVVQDQVAGDEVVWVDYGENPMANEQFMADWTASMTPGKEHEMLASYVGEWKVDSKMWMDPAAPPMDSKGTSSSKMILGGRYSLENYKSEFMGEPFEGMLIQGYDNLKKENFSIWIDTMSTWPSIAKGKRAAGGELVQIGKMHDVSTPGGRPYKHVVRAVGPDSSKFDMYDTNPEGEEFRVMEMTYTRVKGEK